MNYTFFLSIFIVFILLIQCLKMGKNSNDININLIVSVIFTTIFMLINFYLVKTPIIEGNTMDITIDGVKKLESIVETAFKPDTTEDVRINVVNNHRGMVIPKSTYTGYTQFTTDALIETEREAQAIQVVEAARLVEVPVSEAAEA